MPTRHKVDFDAIEWCERAPGARDKVYEHDGHRVRLIEFTKALEHPHWCETGHMAQVLEGELELRFDEETLRYRAGDVLFIPDGESHRHIPRPLTDTVRLFSVESDQGGNHGKNST